MCSSEKDREQGSTKYDGIQKYLQEKWFTQKRRPRAKNTVLQRNVGSFF